MLCWKLVITKGLPSRHPLPWCMFAFTSSSLVSSKAQSLAELSQWGLGNQLSHGKGHVSPSVSLLPQLQVLALALVRIVMLAACFFWQKL